MNGQNSSRRISGRQTKRKCHDDEVVSTSTTNGKKVRGCEKTGCIATEPTCCLNCNEFCAKSGYTSRWYHLSLGEHFCNNCFDHFYRPSKGGNIQFNDWHNQFGSLAKAKNPSIKTFIGNEVLPYWIKCTQRQCGKWRKVCSTETFDSKYIKNFKCQLSVSKTCDVVEDNDVALVLDSNFMNMLAEKPLLKNSPAASSLTRFLSEDIGVCPVDDSGSPENGCHKFIKPFMMEQCGESSIWVKPGMLDEDEIAFAERVAVSFSTYLGLRNLIVAVWNLNLSEWLTIEKVHLYLVCRGLVRIYLISVAEQIVELLANKAVINYGIIVNPSLKLLKKHEKPRVLVVGAGVSGLAAAAHLQNIGVNVTIYEADSEIGGRVKDVPTLGSGAFFVQGLTNNPFSTLAIQAKAQFHTINDNYVVFRANGELVPDKVLRRVQQQVEDLFQGVKESSVENDAEKSFREALDGNLPKLLEDTPYLKDPDVFRNLLALKEIKLHANLSQLSPLGWECPSAVQGEEGFIPNGLRLLLIKLTRGLDVHNNHEVLSINYSGAEVVVKTSRGKASFSKVLITVPLPVLQKEKISFEPPLPEGKRRALKNLETFYCELLILEFPKRFWNKGAKKSFQKFGVISAGKNFEVFFDVTGNKEESIPTLMAYIRQKSLDLFKDKADKDIVDECMLVLKNAFGKSTPLPTKWFLTHWKDHPFGGNFGSHVKTGTDGSAYDDLAASVDDRLYFAGEATFRGIPSTVSGAYLSGLREATKIARDLEL
ncbi:hypothetical protein JTE90_000820 [Oedothorax gibbosus]|uniref:Amine oxidase n=1 Tax=Oedothorax gibbosus TaxID=931172 RepID=A0AAV6VSQ3_9ARAC|nr:hypothetical protein JTE90_000820 [Oedothorax gibbosus]